MLFYHGVPNVPGFFPLLLHTTLMTSVPVRALLSVSVTVMVCLPFFRRMAALTNVWTPASAAVKV